MVYNRAIITDKNITMNIKRLIGSLATAILLISNNPLFAQCPTGDVVLSDQAAVDAFVASYGSCTTIPANLIIGDNTAPIVDSDINDISGLINIVTVSGDLIIQANPLLLNLAGLENLTTVNQKFDIIANAGLTNIDNLSSLTNVSGFFNIMDNDALTYISNLNNLTVGFSLTISNNNALATISGINDLTANRALVIRENDNLMSISGITNFTPGLAFALMNNPMLSSIPNFSFTSPAQVIVKENSILSTCNVPGFCQSIDAGFGSIFELNAAGCSSTLEVEISCTQAPLPVELTYFVVKKLGRTAQLVWRTSSEKNNQGFVVEHSIDGQRWNMIEFVEGNGNSIQTNDYNLIHSKVVPNQNYYRLKQMDFDGTITISEVKRLNFKIESAKEFVQVYPNPNNGSFRIVVPTEEGVRTNLKLSDVQGRVIWENKLDGTENADLFFEDFDLPAPQLYFLHIQIGSDFGVQKIQVIEN